MIVPMLWLTDRAASRLAVTIAALALLAACTAGQTSPAPSIEGTAQATPSEPAPSPQPTATVSPSPSPQPTPQPPAELVLRISHRQWGFQWSTSLVADGRLTSPSETGYQVRVLSLIGIDRVRSEILSTGLFDESADVPLVLLPDADPGCTPELGGIFAATIELAADAGDVSVSWDRRYDWPPDCYEPSAARDGLEALLARLESLHEWLPPEAWRDATPRAYEPHGFRMFTIAQPWRDDAGQPPELETVAWPLGGTLTSYGTALAPPPWVDSSTVRCAAVTAGEATSVVDALADGGAVWTDSTPNGYASATYLGDRSNGLTVALVLQALRPDENSCGAPDLWLLNCWEVGGVYLFYCHVA